ncbi:MAG: NAD(P)-dependent alcohol dehydrogenase [Acidobacteriales bacterium]|nr:NAD(P)-dependent alcohol dehydrogenase [Terriglobales bacterium]
MEATRQRTHGVALDLVTVMKLKRLLKGTARLIAILLALGLLAFGIAYWRSDNDCEQRRASRPKNPMKAIVYCDYGSPEVLKLEEIEKPVPDDDQVLVRVRAASVNPLDYHYMRGTPYVMRMGVGLRKPKVTRLGVDFAGTVEAVGKNVKEFKPGDDVFGGRFGTFAEYVITSERIAKKPERLSFEQAAGVNVAAMTALQALRDHGKVQPGQKVLINGASGGVGTFAVQIAKVLGANVTGVSSTRNLELVKSLGADQVIDYTKEDYTKGSERYDVIVDNVGNHSLSENRRVLTPKGTYVMVSGPKGRWLAPLDRVAAMMVYSKFVEQKMGMMLTQPSKSDLTFLSELMQAGKVTPVIDRRYKLSEVPQAIEYLETGRARGKVVITVE